MRKNTRKQLKKIFKKGGTVYRQLVMMLAVIVVFTTTYSLVLPALTMDTGTADEKAGIQLEEVREAEPSEDENDADEEEIAELAETVAEVGDENGETASERKEKKEQQKKKASSEKKEKASAEKEEKKAEDSSAEKEEKTAEDASAQKEKKQDKAETEKAMPAAPETEKDEDKSEAEPLPVDEEQEENRSDSSADKAEQKSDDPAGQEKDSDQKNDESVSRKQDPETKKEGSGNRESEEEKKETSSGHKEKQADREENITGTDASPDTGSDKSSGQSEDKKDSKEDSKEEEGKAEQEKQLSPVKLARMLTDDTGLWVKNGDGNWERVTAKSQLPEKETLLVRFAYEIPQGSLARNNAKVSMKLPRKLPVDKKTMKMVNDPENHLNQVIEGTRLPGEKAEEDEYLAGKYEMEQTITGRWQLKISFDDYTIAKNAETAVSGWLLFYIKDAKLPADKDGKGSITFSKKAADEERMTTEYTILTEENSREDASDAEQEAETESGSAETENNGEIDLSEETEIITEAEVPEALSSETESTAESSELTESESGEETVAETETTADTDTETETITETETGMETETVSETGETEDTVSSFMPAQTFEKTIISSGTRVSVEAPEGAFPEGTRMEIRDVTRDSDIKAAVEDSVEGEVRKYQAVDITFFAPDGKEIEPAAEISVRISSSLIGQVRDDEELADPQVVHVDNENKAEIVEGAEVSEENENDISFTSSEFSVYAIVYTYISENYVSASGETYTITVVYDEEAGIPNGADLSVREIENGTEEYRKYLDHSVTEFGLENADEVSFARFFDIEISDKNGEKIEPKKPVQVKIEYEDGVDIDRNLNIVHFAEKGIEVITDVQVSADGKEITYEQESFSVTGTIVSNPVGSAGNVRQYAIIVTYEGKDYSVDSDGTLTPVTLEGNTVTIGNAMLWKYDGSNIYHESKDIDTDANRVASGYYWKYIDANQTDCLFEETTYSTTDNNSDVTAYYERTYAVAGGWKDALRIRDRNKKNACAITYVNGHLQNTAGDRFVGIEYVNGVLRLTQETDPSKAVPVKFANVKLSSSGNEVDPWKHTVNHIDIAVQGKTTISTPLAYGTYTYVVNGVTKTLQVTEDMNTSWVADIPIGYEDIKSGTLKAYINYDNKTHTGTEVNNAFYITGYSGNAETTNDLPQVRIDGVFKVANCAPFTDSELSWYGQYSYFSDDVLKRRLDSKVTYVFSTTKYDMEEMKVYYTPDPSKPNEKYQLIDNHGKGLKVSGDITISASFNYWDKGDIDSGGTDKGNTCPALDYLDKGSWQQGAIFNDGDHNNTASNVSGMDFRLEGNRSTTELKLDAIEIDKFIIDETGKLIHLPEDSTHTSKFYVYENTTGTPSYSDVSGVSVGESITRASRPAYPATDADLPTADQYDAPDSSLVSGYTQVNEFETVINHDGKGLVHDYNVTPGMYYIVEDKTKIDDKIEDNQHNTYRYVNTFIETEYAWRDDAYKNYTEAVHVSPYYTKDDDDYISYPEVLGPYKDINGNSLNEDGSPITNGFLTFYVFNVYTPDVKLEVEKKWVNTEVPDGAEVEVELYYSKQMIKTADGLDITLGDWPDKGEYQKVSGAKWNGTDTLIFENSVISQSPLTLKADTDASKNWKGTFRNLPHLLKDSQGNVWEFDYYAKESAINSGGMAIDVTQYDVSEQKVEPVTEEEAIYSDGKVNIINAKGSLSVEKKWLKANGETEYTPDETDVEVTAQLRRRRMVTTVGEDVEIAEDPVRVIVNAQSNNGTPREMFRITDLKPGKSLTFSIGNNDTSWIDLGRAAISPNNTGANLSQTISRDVPNYSGYYTNGKSNANIYMVSNVAEDITINVILPNTSNNNLGYWYDSTYEKPGTIIMPGETITEEEDEAVSLPAKTQNGKTLWPAVQNGVIKLNSANGWKFTLSAADMEPGWTYYINTDPEKGAVITETGVTGNQYVFEAGPIITTDEDGNTVYTAKNIDNMVSLDVSKEWSDGNENHTQDSISYSLYRVPYTGSVSSLVEYDPEEISTEAVSDTFATGFTGSLSSSNSWGETVTNLPKTGTYTPEGGSEIAVSFRYYVTEGSVSGYHSVTTGGEVAGGSYRFTIRNTPTGSFDEPTEVSIHKQWQDVQGEPDNDTHDDDSITFKLTQKKYLAEGVFGGTKKRIYPVRINLINQDGTVSNLSKVVYIPSGETLSLTPSTGNNGHKVQVSGMDSTSNGSKKSNTQLSLSNISGEKEITLKLEHNGAVWATSSGGSNWTLTYNSTSHFGLQDLQGKTDTSGAPAGTQDFEYSMTLNNEGAESVSVITPLQGAQGTPSSNGKWSGNISALPFYEKDGTDYYIYTYEATEVKIGTDVVGSTSETGFNGETKAYFVKWEETESNQWVLTNRKKPTIDIHLNKTDEGGNALAGAIFDLRVNTGTDQDPVYQPVTKAGENSKYQSIRFNSGKFRPGTSEKAESIALQEKVIGAKPGQPAGSGTTYFATFTTPEYSEEELAAGAKMTLEGLPDGQYRLVEVYAPAGYVIVLKEIDFEISNRQVTSTTAASEAENADGQAPKVTLNLAGTMPELTVVNTPGASLPSTGGPGTRLFTIFGTLLILLSGVILWRRRAVPV